MMSARTKPIFLEWVNCSDVRFRTYVPYALFIGAETDVINDGPVTDVFFEWL